MNKEQWVFILSLALLAYGIYSMASKWIPEKQFHPPGAGTRSAGSKVEPMDPPVFASEDEQSLYREGGRDAFQPNRETEPLPLARLELPPLPDLKRVAPGPVPGLGSSNRRPLEEPVTASPIDLAARSGEGEEDEEEDEDDEWGRRRW